MIYNILILTISNLLRWRIAMIEESKVSQIDQVLYRLKKYTTSRSLDKSVLVHCGNYDLLTDRIFDDHANIFVNRHVYSANTTVTRLHRHNFFEINYVMKGHCTQNINNHHTVVLKEGDICIMNPTVKHNLSIVDDENNYVINILIKNNLFYSTFLALLSSEQNMSGFFLNYMLSRDLENNYQIFPIGHNMAIKDTVYRIINEYLNKDVYHETIIASLLIILFSLANRENEKILSSNEFKNKKDAKITAFFQYLSIHYATATLVSTADYLHFTPNYLSSYIKKNTGKSFRYFLDQIKLSHAVNYLLNSNLSVSYISEILGFKQPCNFYNLIKKYHNTTPSEFRLSNN